MKNKRWKREAKILVGVCKNNCGNCDKLNLCRDVENRNDTFICDLKWMGIRKVEKLCKGGDINE